MKNLWLPPNILNARRFAGVFDDFNNYTSGNAFTTLTSGSGASVAEGTAVNGTLVLTTGAGVSGSQAAAATTQKLFQFAQEKPHYFETFLNYTEANTNQAQLFIGFSSTWASGVMQAASGGAGAGPNTNFSGAGFFKVAGGVDWNIVVSNGTTQSEFALTQYTAADKNEWPVSAATGGQYFRVEFTPKTSTLADLLFLLNDVPVFKVTDYVFTSAAAMSAGVYIESGTTNTNSEVANVDYLSAWKLR